MKVLKSHRQYLEMQVSCCFFGGGGFFFGAFSMEGQFFFAHLTIEAKK